MKKLLIMAALLLPLTVLADENGCDDDCNGGGDVFNNSAARAKASLKARLSSNANSKARAKAEANQRQSQGQEQGQYQSNFGIQKGFGAGNTTEIGITSNYEAAANPPALGQGDPGYDCSMTGGVGFAVPGGGGSVQWSDASINCELSLVYRLGVRDPDARDRALDAYDVLYQRVMEQAAGEPDTKRDPSIREGR